MGSAQVGDMCAHYQGCLGALKEFVFLLKAVVHDWRSHREMQVETVSPVSVHVAQIIRWQLGDVKWILLYFSFLPQPSGRHPYTFSVPPVISLGP